MFPRSVSRVGDKELQTISIHISEDVELSFMITYDRGPYTLSIDLIVVDELKFIIRKDIRPAVEAITREFPIDKILGVKYDKTWCTVHSCTS